MHRYRITVASGTVVSNTITANAPTLWWVQGDGGEFATSGGWLRVFGHGLSLGSYSTPTDALDQTSRSALSDVDIDTLRTASKKIDEAVLRGDWHSVVKWSAAASESAERAANSNTLSLVSTPVLTLRPKSGSGDPVVISASAANLSAFAATFSIPLSTPAGVYSVTLSNGAAQGTLDSYYNHTHPHMTTVEIKRSTSSAWSDRTFSVVKSGCNASITNVSTQIDCTGPILAAIAAAGAAGGGQVTFGPGEL